MHKEKPETKENAQLLLDLVSGAENRKGDSLEDFAAAVDSAVRKF